MHPANSFQTDTCSKQKCDMTALKCPSCHGGWGETPAKKKAAKKETYVTSKRTVATAVSSALVWVHHGWHPDRMQSCEQTWHACDKSAQDSLRKCHSNKQSFLQPREVRDFGFADITSMQGNQGKQSQTLTHTHTHTYTQRTLTANLPPFFCSLLCLQRDCL